MAWFRKKITPEQIAPALPPEHQASIEIVAHKNASAEVQKEAIIANKTINNLLERNGFTVNIVVGAIGTPKTKHKEDKHA